VLLESGPVAIHGADIAYPSIIYAFYAQRGFQPAWTNTHTASELRRALKDSEADGLDPRDYNLPVLETLAAGIEGNPSARAAYEILHTDALLRIADHLMFGKVDAASSTRTGTTRAAPLASTFPSASNAPSRATTSTAPSKN
jgi:murein L,D-transpeptidase YcbB/YkuD